ncbi:MogA/MoaB family molybdenum cofactor biosynthesis protein [Streptomyces sp. ITFR-21]|nr:MogA/MoaB family molybdenum cofactor biosynthesis protein [Streptomyces sp. ITFR-21]WNI15888.1 MogA/MoaB family molybdenum cofactor biosynthesis protein [Streptomyces sp. ITFR-21]
MTRPAGLWALAVTASNRAAAGIYEDRGGPLVVAALEELGFAVDGPRIVPDGAPVEQALREAVAEGYDVVITTGGTGISPTDRTPDVTRGLLDYEVPGIAEAIRAAGREKVPTAVLSRGVAGVSGRTLVVNLPGSTGGVKDGLAVLAPLVVHAVDQIRGGDHPNNRPYDNAASRAHGDPGQPHHPTRDRSDDRPNDHPNSVTGRPS